MSYVLCNISALRYHRVPPQVLALCPPIPDAAGDPRRRALRANPFATEVLGLPLHTLTTDKVPRGRGTSVISHIRNSELPYGAIWSTELGVKVSSPLYTLLSLAPSISETHLLMVAYELCGCFSVFRPGKLLERVLEQAYASGQIPLSFGWRRAPASSGKSSDLWMRDPLVDIHELREFAINHKSEHGGKKLLRVAQSITGIVASPLEAQTSILFSLSRRLGGEGIAAPENNVRIDLDNAAKCVAGKGRAYADLLFTSKDQMKAVIVECQGLSIHGSTGVSGEDANRATALQSMGYDVILVTRAQLENPERFRVLSKMLHERLGYAYRPKTPGMVDRESDLRRELFIDWSTLGC